MTSPTSSAQRLAQVLLHRQEQRLNAFNLLSDSAVICTICSRMTKSFFRSAVALENARVRFQDVDRFDFVCYIDSDLTKVIVSLTFPRRGGGYQEKTFYINSADLYEEWRLRYEAGYPPADNRGLLFSA